MFLEIDGHKSLGNDMFIVIKAEAARSYDLLMHDGNPQQALETTGVGLSLDPGSVAPVDFHAHWPSTIHYSPN